MKNLFSFLLFLAAYLIISPHALYAHPGRTDSSGGHTCRTNCENWGLNYGEYHSHGGYTAPAQEPVQAEPAVKEALVATIAPTRVPTSKPTTTPTATPTPEPTKEPIQTLVVTLAPEEPTPTIMVEGETSGSGGGGLVAMGIIGGLSYLGYRKLKKRKAQSQEIK